MLLVKSPMYFISCSCTCQQSLSSFDNFRSYRFMLSYNPNIYSYCWQVSVVVVFLLLPYKLFLTPLLLFSNNILLIYFSYSLTPKINLIAYDSYSLSQIILNKSQSLKSKYIVGFVNLFASFILFFLHPTNAPVQLFFNIR